MNGLLANIRFCLLYICSLLPLRVHYFFSGILAFILRHIVRYRASTITVNLARSFPELKYREISRLAGEYYRYMCDIMVESVWDLSHSASAVCRVSECVNPEVVDRLQEKHGRVLILMGHFGNFELVSGMCGPDGSRGPESFANNPIYMVYKAPESRSADILFRKLRMHEYRKFRSLGEVVESKNVIRHVLRNRDAKCAYVLIADQNPLGQKHHAVSFLNQPTYFMNGPEYIAGKTSMPVVYLSMDRVRRGKYRITFTPVTENAAAERENFVTERYAQLLEEDIRRNKVNWLWSHRRWKKNVTL